MDIAPKTSRRKARNSHRVGKFRLWGGPVRFAGLLILVIAFIPLKLQADTNEITGKSERDEQLWTLTTYQGQLSDETLFDMASLKASYDTDYRFVALALARRLAWLIPHLSLEAEGQLAKHTGAQDHNEVNGLLSLRWHRFPWDHALTTSVAAGAGLSYASQTPEFELLSNSGKTKKLLGYLMFELALGLPSRPRWAVVARVHHRSGAYGLFGDNIRGASNALALGLQYRF